MMPDGKGIRIDDGGIQIGYWKNGFSWGDVIVITFDGCI